MDPTERPEGGISYRSAGWVANPVSQYDLNASLQQFIDEQGKMILRKLS